MTNRQLTIVPEKAEGIQATVLPDGRWILYNPAEQTTLTVSAPAGIFWELCDGQATLAAIISQLQEYYPDTPAKRITAETLALFEEFLTSQVLACCKP